MKRTVPEDVRALGREEAAFHQVTPQKQPLTCVQKSTCRPLLLCRAVASLTLVKHFDCYARESLRVRSEGKGESRKMIPRQSLLVRARGGGPVPDSGGAGSSARQTHPELRLPKGSEAAPCRVQLLLLLLTARVGPHLPLLPDGS